MEVNFTPNVSGGTVFSLPTLNSDLYMLGIKGRRFMSEKLAYRATANVAMFDDGEDHGENVMALGLGFGVERHLKGAERLSTYWGYEANIAYIRHEDYDEVDRKMGVGANIFAGADYYIIPKVYLGAEVSYGVAVVNTDPAEGADVTSVQVAPRVTPSLRLGWQF